MGTQINFPRCSALLNQEKKTCHEIGGIFQILILTNSVVESLFGDITKLKLYSGLS